MNRDYIIDNDIIGRYVAGTLSQEESEDFELAYFNDEELAAMVLTEQRLRSSLAPQRTTALPHWSARTSGEGQQPESAEPRRRTQRRSLLTQVAAVVAVALPAAWFLGPWQGPEGRNPRVLTQVLSLQTPRGIGSEPSLPASTTPQTFVALHIDAAQVPGMARAAVLVPDGLSAEPLVTFDEAQIDESHGLVIEVPASRLPPGAYVLELRDGEGNAVQTLPFRITFPSPL
ncbi:MAG: hypothetical protein AAF184_19240 [Pseudomonadota bacterium]